MAAMQQDVVQEHAGHHRLPDGYGTNADARVMATLGHNLGFCAISGKPVPHQPDEPARPPPLPDYTAAI